MKLRAISHSLALLLCAAAFLYNLPAHAQTPSLDLQVTPAFDGNYVTGSWLPLTLTITNNGPAISARISASIAADPASYAQDRQLAGGETQRLTLYVAMSQAAREIHVEVAQGATTLVEQMVAVRPRVNERMLGILAGSDLTLSLPRRQDLTSMPFNVLSLDPESLPDRAEGLGSLDMLIIYDVPPESLSPAQINALLGWVHAGGHLFLGGGLQARLANAWLPEDLQAATTAPGQPIDDQILAGLAETAGPGRLQALQLTPVPGGIMSGPADAPAWVSRPVGRGVITQLAFDPGDQLLRAWPAAPQFWDRFLRPELSASEPQVVWDNLQAQVLAGALTAVPSIAQPPIDLFFIILIIYTILIGPVLALLLRQIDRQAWSWLIVPTFAVSVGLLLLTLALNMRADSRIINQLTLVESLGAGQARARTFVGILAPQQQTFTTDVSPEALISPLPMANGLYGQISGISGPLSQESDQREVSVDAWSMQGFVAEQQVALEEVSAEILIEEQGILARVNNQSIEQLQDVVAVYGEQVIQMGSIRPGEEVSRRWPPQMNLGPPGTAVSSIIFSDAIAAAQAPGQAAKRRIQARMALINTALAEGSASADPGPLILAWIERSPLEVSFDAQGAAQQSLTLLIIRPHIRGSGTVILPKDWLYADLARAPSGICFDSPGTGIAASPAPVTLLLRVPDALTMLKASAITLNLDSAATWPNAGVVTEIYDWEQAKWVEQPFDGPGDLVIQQPERYLAQGQLQLRLSGTIEQARCLYIHTELQGSMP